MQKVWLPKVLLLQLRLLKESIPNITDRNRFTAGADGGAGALLH
jgi:hypothetical protein